MRTTGEPELDEFEFDEIGRWSEIKIEIMRKYAAAYSTILSNTQAKLSYAYIDGFCGAGQHKRKGSGEIVEGCALAALNVQPSFDRYYFVDMNGAKIDYLTALAQDRENVQYFVGDANRVLVNSIFPNERYGSYRRALCLLDPYGLDLEWGVISAAAAERSIEIVLNFPVMDMNRNVFWKDHERVSPANISRMNAFWGDETWRDVAYSRHNLFVFLDKTDNETVAGAFRDRLLKVAGFPYVPPPLPMGVRQRIAAVAARMTDAERFPIRWPLPNVWLGVSVEDRARKHRIKELRATRAAVRFLSIEPLLESLGPIELTDIHWVIVGGESGPRARAFHVSWAEEIVRQCRDAGVACFVKQLGALAYVGHGERIHLSDSKGGDWQGWPDRLRVREFPEAA